MVSDTVSVMCWLSSKQVQVKVSNPLVINALRRDGAYWRYRTDLDVFVADYRPDNMSHRVGFITVYRQAAEDSSKDLLTHVLDKLHGGGRHGDK